MNHAPKITAFHQKLPIVLQLQFPIVMNVIPCHTLAQNVLRTTYSQTISFFVQAIAYGMNVKF